MLIWDLGAGDGDGKGGEEVGEGIIRDSDDGIDDDEEYDDGSSVDSSG